MRPPLHLLLLVVLLPAVGCVSTENQSVKTPLVPDKVLKLTASKVVSLEGVAGAALVFAVIDPLAPNWQVESRALGGKRYDIALTMKRFVTGGDGEARQVFLREAGRLARENGAADFHVDLFAEGIESEVFVSRRVARGVVELR